MPYERLHVRIFHKVVISTSPTNREGNVKGFVKLKNTHSEKAPMENKHFFCQSLFIIVPHVNVKREHCI